MMKLRIAKKILLRDKKVRAEASARGVSWRDLPEIYSVKQLNDAWMLVKEGKRFRSKFYAKTGLMRDSSQTLVLEQLVLRKSSHQDVDDYVRQWGLWRTRGALAGLLRDLARDEEARRHEVRIRTLLSRLGGKKFDWLYEGVSPSIEPRDDLAQWKSYGCFYTPKDDVEERALHGDRDVVCAASTVPTPDEIARREAYAKATPEEREQQAMLPPCKDESFVLTHEHWSRKTYLFPARITKFDRDTGVATIELDSGRLGYIRYNRLKDVLPVVVIENVPFDQTHHDLALTTEWDKTTCRRVRELTRTPRCWTMHT